MTARWGIVSEAAADKQAYCLCLEFQIKWKNADMALFIFPIPVRGMCTQASFHATVVECLYDSTWAAIGKIKGYQRWVIRRKMRVETRSRNPSVYLSFCIGPSHTQVSLPWTGSASSIRSTPSLLSLSSDFKLPSRCLPELLELPLIGLPTCTFLSLKTILTTAGRILFSHVRRLFLFSDKIPSCQLLCVYGRQSPPAVTARYIGFIARHSLALEPFPAVAFAEKAISFLF